MTAQSDAHIEGDDVDDVHDPLLMMLFGDQVAGCVVDDNSLTATGPGNVKALAAKLLDMGQAPDRKLELLRGPRLIRQTTIGAAAQRGDSNE